MALHISGMDAEHPFLQQNPDSLYSQAPDIDVLIGHSSAVSVAELIIHFENIFMWILLHFKGNSIIYLGGNAWSQAVETIQ